MNKLKILTKRSFSLCSANKGSHTYLTKYLLDNIIEDSAKPLVEVDLIAPKEIIFIMKNEFLTKLFVEDDVLFINMENE